MNEATKHTTTPLDDSRLFWCAFFGGKFKPSFAVVDISPVEHRGKFKALLHSYTIKKALS